MPPVAAVRKNQEAAKLIHAVNPATLEEIGTVRIWSDDEVRDAVRRGREAQPAWAALSFEERAKYLYKARDYAAKNVDRLAEIISKENGKPRVEAVSADLFPFFYSVTYFGRNARKLLRDDPISMPLWTLLGKRSYIHYRPLGVVGIISPWNFPFAIPMTGVTMALIAGNAVVLKPSSNTALIGEAMREVWQAAGLPEGVFTVVSGPGSIGDALVNAPCDKILFTGSVGIGKHVAQEAAKHLTPVTLELGGKDPLIVLEDADLDTASSAAVWGAFTNAGQVCASVERCYVAAPVFDRFVQLVTEKAKKLRQGADRNFDVDVGPMTNASQLKEVDRQVSSALRSGAKALVGGKARPDLKGFFFEPTVLVDVDQKSEVMQEETFGPVLPILPFRDEDEAVRLANDSRFALTASVWTKNLERGERLARRILAGTVIVNNHAYTYGALETPWGGPKESGIGRTHGAMGLKELMEPIHIHIDRFGKKMKQPWWYPYRPSSYVAFASAMKLFARQPLGARLKLVREMLKNFSLRGLA